MEDPERVDYSSLIGQPVGNVTLLKELGRGSRGIVFIGYQQSLRRQVAVKLLPKDRQASTEVREKFQHEAETVASLTHPHIVPIFEIGENNNFYFQIMQLVQGSDLSVLIKKQLNHPLPGKRLLPVEQTFQIILQVLEGLSYAHLEGVVHQDMKPANILIEERSGRALIADFGIAKTVVQNFTSPGIAIGTPLYLSPEQAAGQATDAGTDIYAVGIILFEMLAGVLPIHQEGIKELLYRKIVQPQTFFTRRPSQASPIISAELEEILLKALAPLRQDRFKTSAEFMKTLLNYKQKNLNQ